MVEQLVKIVREGRNLPVYVGPEDEAERLLSLVPVKERGKYDLMAATEGNATWWQWYLQDNTLKALLAQGAVYGTISFDGISRAMGIPQATWWSRYSDACKASGRSNRDWDKVLWESIKHAKANVIERIASVG
jgi:hypothetical protein